MREGTKEAISLDSREYDISVIENREGEFMMIRQIEEGDTKGGIIIPRDNLGVCGVSKEVDENTLGTNSK